MKPLQIRKLEDDIHLKLDHIAKEKNISKSELVRIIIKRSLADEELEKLDRKITNHLNEHNNTVNRLIDVNAEIVKEINNLSAVIKHYMR
ncbi:hypothetical protein [Macrococcus bovicus]|uniref:hypothetical protein n=1 Tax=Macrococcus bovicus TaxID=69968 RepID=UPI0025A5C433|nr:hypothetical protein [Macrococcus bovicus]WJP96738.1 hypothetical protein QSV55_00055 [Macrococcus bovicus]